MSGQGIREKINEIKQPIGGFIPISYFKVTAIKDGLNLGKENLPHELVSHAVDHLTSYMLFNDVTYSFKQSLSGFFMKNIIRSPEMGDSIESENINSLLNNISGLSDEAIIAACKASVYDFWVSDPKEMLINSMLFLEPDKETILNIRTMVNRCLSFSKKYNLGSKKVALRKGFDEDFLLSLDSVWIISSLDKEPDSVLSLKLLIYLVDLINEGKAKADDIKTLGIFNPRLNKIYRLPIKKIDKEILRAASIDAKKWREDKANG